MLIGKYQHTLDAKGRVNFPAKLKADLGDRFIVAKGLQDRCLCVYSMDEWTKLEEKIASLPMSKARNIQRFLFASAVVAEPDKQGRIVLPADLREYAGLEKEVSIIGVSVRAEIWDKDTYENICEVLSDDVVQAMEDLGI